MIRVLVWAASRVTQAGLEAIVEADARFQIAPSPASARTLSSAAQQAEPDVILLDGGDLGRSAASAGFIDLPRIPVVVLTDASARGEILRLRHSGVRGIVLQDAPPHEIAAALEAAAEGLAVVSPEILELLFPAGEGAPEPDLPEALTPRESEVLALLAVGASNKEIAGRLHLSEHTVKFHVSTILGKLGAATRAEAVARGYRQGLIVI